MSDTVAAAAIAAVATVTGAVLTFIVGVRSLKRSMKTSDGVPLARSVDAGFEQMGQRFQQLERRLERLEGSLGEVRETLAYQQGPAGPSRWAPRPPG